MLALPLSVCLFLSSSPLSPTHRQTLQREYFRVVSVRPSLFLLFYDCFSLRYTVRALHRARQVYFTHRIYQEQMNLKGFAQVMKDIKKRNRRQYKNTLQKDTFK